MKVASSSMGMDFSISWKPFFLDPRLPGGEGKDKLAHYKSKFGEALAGKGGFEVYSKDKVFFVLQILLALISWFSFSFSHVL